MRTSVSTPQKPVYSVSEVTRFIKNVLEAEDILSGLWVKGEISNVSRPSSGHIYFTLKDETAQLRSVMFREENKKLKFKPEDGMSVIACGRVSIYEKSGSVQLYVSDMQPEGIGALSLAFEQLKNKLKEEGLFDEARKKPVPDFPRRIGVLTSPTGAAVRDIITTIKKRYRLCDVIVIPAVVQGDEAVPSLLRGLKLAESLSLDVLIVARGGGSLEDLWAFNEEPFARALARCSIPTITGIGHEIDTTIADYVADFRAPTPTGAAAHATPDSQELKRNIDDLKFRLAHALRGNFEDFKRRYENVLSSRIVKLPMEIPSDYRQQTDDFSYKLHSHLKHSVQLRKQQLLSLSGRLRMVSMFTAYHQKLEAIFYKISVHAKHGIERHTQKLSLLSGKLNSLSPLHVLERGYSVARILKGQKVIKTIKDASEGGKAEIFVRDGKVFCDITGTEAAREH